ncbi:MAG: lysylphosphatidylglycerol synthetase family protein [Phycisphaerales bacterium]|nr:lysylphosphatidylglycerol synthetase family protein [Phycisphaerales bacterium]
MTDPQESQSIVPPAPESARWSEAWRVFRWVLQIGVPILVIALIWHELHALNIHRVRAILRTVDFRLFVVGVGVAFAAVAIMGLYDAIAFPRGAAGRLRFGGRWLLGFVIFGWTNFLSMGPLGGPAMRLVAYRRYGLSATEITRGLTAHYFGTSGGLVAWLIACWIPIGSGVAALGVRIGVALALSIVTPWILSVALVPILRLHRYGADLEGLPLMRLGAVSFLDWGLTLVSFMTLMRSVGVMLEPFGAARTVFTGQFAGLASMIPGGLGSADAVWLKGLALLGVAHDTGGAAIVIFRTGFYLIPWALSLIVIYTVIAKQSDRFRLWQRRLVAGAVMLNSVLLLLSAATPAVRDRLHAVARIVPLGAIEASHAMATVTAVIMLFLVRGLFRGYRSAYIFTMVMLGASAIAHPLKGGDYEEAFASIVLMTLLFGVRKAFVRKGRVPIGWELTLGVALGALAMFLVVGFTAFERIPYSQDLWVRVAEHAEASRFLRASILFGAISLAAIARQAMRPVSLRVTPSELEIQRAEAFARRHAESADPLLVGGADKGVWFCESQSGQTIGMMLFQRLGDKLIVFKDPVIASGADPREVINGFLAFAESIDVDVIFSMVSTEWMGRLHDFGFHFLKVSQEAIVPLAGFSLQGGKNSGFRRTIREVEKAGIRFEVLEPPFSGEFIDQLREVSDSWLAAKGGREMQFSACCFSPRYLQRNPVGIARDATGRVVAFVNMLITRPGGPATLDYMRYAPDVIDNLMDYVIILTIQHAAGMGATSFSLGGAALSDVGTQRHSRLAERLLNLFSRRAERVYNYQGLLRYKTKFHPEWAPRYLAFSQPWDWAASLLANARLVEARSRGDRRRIAEVRLESSLPAAMTESVAAADA